MGRSSACGGPERKIRARTGELLYFSGNEIERLFPQSSIIEAVPGLIKLGFHRPDLAQNREDPSPTRRSTSRAIPVPWRVIGRPGPNSSLTFPMIESTLAPRGSRGWLLTLLASISVMFTVSLAGQEPTPSDVDLALARGTFQQHYERELGSRKPEDRRRLAHNLVTRARAESTESALRYVLLDEARQIAAEIGELHLALEAVLELDERFEVPERTLRLGVLESIPKGLQRGLLAASLAHAHHMVAREFAREGKFERAEKALEEALALARRSRLKNLIRALREKEDRLEDFAVEHARIQLLEPEIEAGTAGPETNLAVGLHRAARLGDWESALPLLATGSDAVLRVLADADQMQPDGVQSRMMLAFQWIRHASKEKEAAIREALLRRGEYWLLMAGDGAETGDLELINQELDELAPLLTPDVLIEPEDFIVHCWEEPRWFRQPATRVNVVEGRGVWEIEESSGIHSRSKVLVRRPLPGDFRATIEIRGGHRIGLTARDGQDRNISVELDDEFRVYQIQRKGGRLDFLVDGKPADPKLHKTAAGMDSFLAITLKSGQTCQIRALRFD